MVYSMDYRRAVAAAHDECGSSAEVAEQFGCSESWVRRLIQHRRERGTLEPLSTARRDQQRTYGDADERKILELIERRLDATLKEVAEALGKPAHECTVSRTLTRLGLARKKSTHAGRGGACPSERDRPDVKAARDAWFEQFAGVRVDQLVFVDEFGAATNMQRTHAARRRASGWSARCRTATGRRSAPSPP